MLRGQRADVHVVGASPRVLLLGAQLQGVLGRGVAAQPVEDVREGLVLRRVEHQLRLQVRQRQPVHGGNQGILADLARLPVSVRELFVLALPHQPVLESLPEL
eukprot:1669016-Pyramimonas_sp.AAC.1